MIFGAFNQESFPIQTCTGTKKNKKTNHWMHQKNQKKPKPQQLVWKHGHRFGIFGFFDFFGACAGLAMVAPWFLWFFWCLPVFCEVKLSKPAPKKTKKQTTRCTKPAQAPKKTKKTKPQQLVWKHGHRFGIFGFFGFFGACAGLVMVALCFLWFFWCLCRFGEPSHSKYTVFAEFCEPHHIINIKNLLFTWVSEHPNAKNTGIYSVV